MTQLFSIPTSNGPLPGVIDTAAIDLCTDAELDQAPFGVICLDEEGTILRYNLFESRFARLDRNQVLGRDFFQEVARCTRVPEFEGRYRHIVAGSEAPDDRRFTFVFDFVFGAQEVLVEIVSVAGATRWYLLINRARVSGPRSSPREPAVLQSELAPLEASLGLKRDAVEGRFVETPASFFAAMRATLGQLAPEAWPMFAHELGVQWGRRAVIELEGSALEADNVPLVLLPMSDAATRVGQYFDSRGWGKVHVELDSVHQGVIEIAVERSVLAEAAPLWRAQDKVEPPSCAIFAGAFAGMFSHLAGRRLGAREFSCIALGAECCRFVLFAANRVQRVDDAIGQGADTADAVRDALRAPPRAAS